MNRRKRAQRVGDALLSVTPRIVITDTYQVMLATALLAMGLITLITLLTGESTGAISHTLTNNVLRVLWGVSLALGGGGQLVGVHRSNRETERFGLTMSAIGSAVYAYALFTASSTTAGLILGVVFTFITLAYALVLYVSSLAKRLVAT
jgi:hypothetical protein